MPFMSILETLVIGPLKLLFEMIFQLAVRFINHPGIAIIVLSLTMNILVLPLYRRADAMQEEAKETEAKLSRGVNHIKKTFSGDERMMILQTYYRQKHYKPTSALNGSVSLLLEIPFFMAAYQFLSTLGALRGISLGPIADLAAPDGLIAIGALRVNLLPILMTLINVISAAIYLKGFPLKTKIQLYGIAAFFLVFLYTSPSGLVFYWTLNNVFSLVKNIFYKIKNPGKIIKLIAAMLGVCFIVAGPVFFSESLKRVAVLVALGVVLLVPFVWGLINRRGKIRLVSESVRPNKKVFVLGCIFLTVLIGFMIPSTYIAASPQEYIDPTNFHDPLWYIVSSGAMAAGFFLVWFGVFYWLANTSGKVLFERAVWLLCGVTVVNYMLFGTDLGTLSADLIYENGMAFEASEMLINAGVLVAVCGALLLILFKLPKLVPTVLLVASVAFCAMSGLHVYTTAKSVNALKEVSANVSAQDASEVGFTLSKTEENVVIIMLDRALGSYFGHFAAEKPELIEQFDGFTCYTNAISHGGFTNFCAPAVFGGYEYTPVELNKRDGELLVEKHNESLKVLPVLFEENGYEVSIFDPCYANYQWLPDITLFDGFENTNAYVATGYFTDPMAKAQKIQNGYRNFFCFSLMKTMPLAVQPMLYHGGDYHQAPANTDHVYTVQTVLDENGSVANGMSKLFADSYNVISNLPVMTRVEEGGKGAFVSMVNNTTHEPTLLQKPDYTLSSFVDNTAYDTENALTVDGRTILVEDTLQKSHYQTNMAIMLRLGEWFDYLREQGVYDNTKIILVSDHGRHLGSIEELIIGEHDTLLYHPLLMVKDFNGKGFTYSDEFMTNADVPALAVEGAVEDPVNPMTGNPINMDEKTAHDQIVIVSAECYVDTNNGYSFLPAKWASVHDDMWNADNWSFYEEETVLKEHALPTE